MDLDRCDPDGVDFRALDYISTYDAHLMCPICRCPFVRPVRLQCDHIFCRTCLDSAITCSSSRDDFTCPTCRSPTSDTSVNVPRMLINMCDDIRVKCPFSREGCSEIIPRGHVQLHVDKYCAYRLVDCPDEGCDKKTTKMHLHPEGKCMHELRHCPHCEEDVMEQDFEVCRQSSLSDHANTRTHRTTPKTSVPVSKLPVPTARPRYSEKPSTNTSPPARRRSTPAPPRNMAVP